MSAAVGVVGPLARQLGANGIGRAGVSVGGPLARDSNLLNVVDGWVLVRASSATNGRRGRRSRDGRGLEPRGRGGGVERAMAVGVSVGGPLARDSNLLCSVDGWVLVRASSATTEGDGGTRMAGRRGRPHGRRRWA